MNYESLKRHLIVYNNCYVSEYPSNETIEMLEKELNAKVIVSNTKYLDGGYVVEKINEAK